MDTSDIMQGFRYHGSRECIAQLFYAPIFDCIGDYFNAARLLWHPYDEDGTKQLRKTACEFSQRAGDARKYSIAQLCPNEDGLHADCVISSAAFRRSYMEEPVHPPRKRSFFPDLAAAEICIMMARQLIQEFIPMIEADGEEKRYNFLRQHAEFLKKAWRETFSICQPIVSKREYFPGMAEKALHIAKQRALYAECQGFAVMQKRISEQHEAARGSRAAKQKGGIPPEAIKKFIQNTGMTAAVAEKAFAAPALWQDWNATENSLKGKVQECGMMICDMMQIDRAMSESIKDVLSFPRPCCDDIAKLWDEREQELTAAPIGALVAWYREFAKIGFLIENK